jgi:hypothetical protein
VRSALSLNFIRTSSPDDFLAEVNTHRNAIPKIMEKYRERLRLKIDR